MLIHQVLTHTGECTFPIDVLIHEVGSAGVQLGYVVYIIILFGIMPNAHTVLICTAQVVVVPRYIPARARRSSPSRLGPAPGDVKEARVVNLVITWHEDRFERRRSETG